MKKFKKVFDIVTLIMIIVGQIIQVVLESLSETIDWGNILSSSIILVFAIFCISTYFELHSFKDKMYKEINEVKRSSNITNTKAGKGSDDFYELGLEYLGVSQSSVWLTSLNINKPSRKGSITRNKYFDSVFPFAKRNQTVEIKRIVKIPTLDKLDWVIEQLKSTENLDNVSIAYVENDIDILNLQIFDEKYLLLWNPGKSRVSPKYNKFIFSENIDIVEMFSEYYENLWKRLQNNQGGFIIKDGSRNNISDIDNKLNIIREKLMRNN